MELAGVLEWLGAERRCWCVGERWVVAAAHAMLVCVPHVMLAFVCADACRRRVPRRWRRATLRAPTASSWKPRRIRERHQCTRRRLVCVAACAQGSSRLPALPPVLCSALPACSLHRTPPHPLPCSYDVVFMSINEPFRLVLSDVRARLQRTK